MKSFFDGSDPLLRPDDIVTAFTKRRPDELVLPPRAVIVFSPADLGLLVRRKEGRLLEPWSGRRKVYLLGKGAAVATRSGFGGGNTAALVEEFAAFGVKEFLLWGYCGAIAPDLGIGDLVVAESALREEGVSYHYLPASDEEVFCSWPELLATASASGFRRSLVWTTDALYRETSSKVEQYRRRNVAGVEMETASLYAVCRFKGLKGGALLVVSDTLGKDGWRHGFFSRKFREGVRTLADVICKDFIE